MKQRRLKLIISSLMRLKFQEEESRKLFRIIPSISAQQSLSRHRPLASTPDEIKSISNMVASEYNKLL